MNLSKFVDELPIPPVIKPRWKDHSHTYYEVTMSQFKQSLHRDLPETTVWGFEGLYPGPTFEVESAERVFVKWINNLPDRHLLPVDHTIHGAHLDVPEVRTVIHLHGASVEWESDGYPEAWFTNGFAQKGPYFVKEIYRYDNYMPACTLWYHDHSLGITRLNVYAGLAGFYLIKDQREQELNLPRGPYDIPLIIQDKSFHPDGALVYPTQPKSPVKELQVSIVPEFLGDTILVNGKVWPYLNVEPRKYRFRLLNGSNTRFYRLKLEPKQPIYQIATDSGLIESPIELQEIILAPAERVEVIIDFSKLQGKRMVMTNDAPFPFPDGDPVNPETVGNVMEFRVVLPLSSPDTSTIPSFMVPHVKRRVQTASKFRFLTLTSKKDPFGRELMLLDDKDWDAPITENPKAGQTEVWYLINLTHDTHPIHLHLVDFWVIDRRPFHVEKYIQSGRLEYTGPAIHPSPQESGRKDTVIAYANQVTRIIMKFGPYTGLYVWHCHILEHEDYVMMRPFRVI